MPEQKPFLTVFIPAYNEESNLPNCVRTILAKMAELSVTVEILVIDDGSRDGTFAVANLLAAQDQRVRVVRHVRNLGVGGAFLTAVQHARGEFLILIPADLAIHPDELAKYLEAAPGADIVVGLRSDRSDYTLARRIVSWSNIHLIQLLFGMKERQFQYICLYRMAVFQQVHVEFWRSAFFHAEILIKAKTLGFRLVEVDIRYAPRLTGRATGAKFLLILKTVQDILLFWLRWISRGKMRACRYNSVRAALPEQVDADQPPKRPTSVTWLTAGVLILAVLFLTRLVMVLAQWSFLSDLAAVSPAYMLLTGLVWTGAFLALFGMLWRGRRGALCFGRRVVVTYTVYAWLDRIFVAKNGVSSNSNWPFLVGMTVVLLSLALWILSRKKVKAFYGELHEHTS